MIATILEGPSPSGFFDSHDAQSFALSTTVLLVVAAHVLMLVEGILVRWNGAWRALGWSAAMVLFLDLSLGVISWANGGGLGALAVFAVIFSPLPLILLALRPWRS
ncbi:MAG: hypothetical protein JF886_01225 [Candidatus Dormibacteraeota bacterium]|uniref:Uncharacterized protein n=1 Tax=Candidatus Aeolococcus gillhamiae TaxID=3127015 RepID=A0A934JZT0_9BACT|nr:hypothetical protein [Candidatus Dormibacteraeota bacterium]